MRNVDQVAKLFGVSKTRVFGWIRDGKLEAIDLSEPGANRRHMRISDEAIADFKKRRSTLPSREDGKSLPPVETIV